jgi:uncharacterized protein with von Willebrand factor type A (vWA) domain
MIRSIPPMAYEVAIDRHTTVEQASREFKNKQVKDEGRMVWVGVTTTEEVEPDTYEDAARMSMPADCIPIVRTTSGVQAAFIFERLAAQYQPKGDFFLQAQAAWKEFEERRKLANEVEKGYGCDKSASWELARDITQVGDASRVEEIARMAGAMKKALDGARKVPTDDPHEVVGVQQGGEVERLIASEIAEFCDPDLSDAAAIRILEKHANQYKMKGKGTGSRGPLVIAIDESGSMGDDGHGDRNSWAKACAVALTRVAHEGNRMVKVVHYATSTVTSELAPGNHKAVLDMTRHFLNGGTDIARALAVSAKEVGNLAKAGFVGADIVLITDGEDPQHPAMEKTLALANSMGIRLWTVAIECNIDPKSPIVRRAMEVIRVGGTMRADMVALLRGAAENVVTQEEQQAAEVARNQAMN